MAKKKTKPEVKKKKKAEEKDYYVYFAIHVRLRLDKQPSAEAAEAVYWNMSDTQAMNDGSVLQSEVEKVVEVDNG